MNKIDLYRLDEISIQYHPKIHPSVRPKVNSSQDAFNLLSNNWSNNLYLQEEFNILLLDNQKQVLGISNIAKGGISSTVVDLRLAFTVALKSRASSIIMAHNHPSGTNRPSRHDVTLTQKFIEAGNIINIQVCDHIILSGTDSYYSFLDEHYEFFIQN